MTQNLKHNHLGVRLQPDRKIIAQPFKAGYGRLAFAALILLILLPAALIHAAPWETLPPDHWAYEEIRWLQVGGWLQDLDPSAMPYRRGDVARALELGSSPDGGAALQRFQRLEAEFDADLHPTPGWSFFSGGRIIAGVESSDGEQADETGFGAVMTGVGNERMGIFTSQRGDLDLPDHPTYSGKSWNELAGFTEAAYAVLTGRRWAVMLGRDHLWWGPGQDHLLLGPSPRGLDRLGFQARWSWGRFDAFAGQVSDDTLGERTNRFLSGHRLQVIPWRWLRLGISETLLFTSFRLGSFNPFLPYYGELVNEHSEGNGFVGLDAIAYPLPGLQAYGEILVDDVQIEKDKPEDLEPPEWGWRAGLRWSGLEGLLGAGISYEGVTHRTYNAGDPVYRYQNYGLLLGSDLGNDADRLRVDLLSWFPAPLRLNGYWELTRRGEGDPFAPFDSSYMNYTIEQGYDEPFPTGVVERTSTVGLDFWLYGDAWIQLQGGMARDWIRNAGHVSGVADDGWRGQAAVAVRLDHAVSR